LKKTAEKTIEIICDGCGGGKGFFYDFDSDFGGGIGICGFCGGIGRRILGSKDFMARTERIRSLRHEYCPDITSLSFSVPPLPEVVQLQKLKMLIKEIKKHFKIYGRRGDDCFARDIARGSLNQCIKEHRKKVKAEIIKLKDKAWQHRKDKPYLAAIFAHVIAYQGNLPKSDMAFEKAIEKYPVSSIVVYGYAIHILTFHRSCEKALPWFEKLIQLEPENASYLYQAAECMLDANSSDVTSILKRAQMCAESEKNEHLIAEITHLRKRAREEARYFCDLALAGIMLAARYIDMLGKANEFLDRALNLAKVGESEKLIAKTEELKTKSREQSSVYN